MSSRALRKAQRLREQQQQEEEESGSEEAAPRTQGKPSAFELLVLSQAEDDQDDDEAKPEARVEAGTDDDDSHEEDGDSPEHKPKPASTSKRKKKKNKKAKKGGTTPGTQRTSDIDDIDAALEALSGSLSGKGQIAKNKNQAIQDKVDQALLDVLSVDPHHLNVRNEMKRLFGDISFNDPDEEAQRRPARQGDQVGLSELVKGTNSISGAGLPAMIRRRNVFIQGSEEWPKAASGGLSMELEGTNSDGSIQFKYVHNKAYQSAQREFEASVQSMDPMIMVNLLRFNPYHISTLLQVSEIAKQEKDYATAGDLLERALFSFGRALHPRFAQAMSQGKARLDFCRPENREFYLASWRYIQNIGMRATWRTAFEWAKLVLQLSPDEDPYSIILLIDQLAVRCRQTDALLKLCTTVQDLSDLPNLQYSKALAQHMSKHKEASQSLQEAIQAFPWIAAQLCHALSVSKTPPSVWGTEAPTERTKLHSELYTTQAVDLWKTSENTAFLTDAANTVKRQDTKLLDEGSNEILTSEARHVLLLEKPPLIGLLPSRLTSTLTSSSDPLPPSNDLRSYETGISDQFTLGGSSRRAPPVPQDFITHNPQGFIEVLSETNRVFEFLMPGIGERLDAIEPGQQVRVDDGDVARALHQSNLPRARFQELLDRLLAFRHALAAQPGRRVEASDGSAAYYTQDGHLRIEPGRDSDEEADASEEEMPHLEEPGT